MATTFRKPGDRLTKTVPTGGVSSGDVNVIRSGATGLIGVWLDDYSAAASGVLLLTGDHELPAVNNAAFAVGDLLYWDDSANKLTKTATGNTRAGTCTATKATAGTTGRVLLNH